MFDRTWRVAVLALALACAIAVPLGAVDVSKFNGRPTFKGGDSYGYCVWKDGDTWKLRWTTFGANRHFKGTVRAGGSGELVDLKRIDVDAEWKVIAPGRPPRVVRGPHGQVVGVQPGRGPVVAEKTPDHITREDAKTITFSTRTNDDIDGFDFKVKGKVNRLRFSLQIDGKSHPVDVYIGKGNEHPADNPFVATLR